MSDLERLEKKIALLEKELVKLKDREEIKELRHKYWRCMRDRLADEIMESFTENAELEFGHGLILKGKKAIGDFYRDILGSKDGAKFYPQGHNPEIEMTSETTAKGIWLLDVMNIDSGGDSGTRVGVQYDEWYVKESKGWHINKMVNTYLYYEAVTLKEGP
jgi:hypothetical protein